MFHKSNLGRFGADLPCDIDGYVPTEGDKPFRFRWDYFIEWTPELWSEFLARAIEKTAQATQALAEWQEPRGPYGLSVDEISADDGPIDGFDY